MRWIIAIAVVMVVGMVISANAAALNSAKVGDRIGALTVGLNKIDEAKTASCGSGPLTINAYVVPGKDKSYDNASTVTVSTGSRVLMAITFDEDDLTTAAAVYEADKNGIIVQAYSIDQAPQDPCEIVNDALAH